MAGSVIERIGTTVENGVIKHDDRLSTFEAAEKIAGRKLDRRRSYAIIGGQVGKLARWSQACSGCYDGHYSDVSTGIGCDECGYTGRRRHACFVPIQKKAGAA